ncbi:CdaR family protein [Kamptonema cortianum]|nr:CdaR family protein [Kamptonema cortianum]
MNRQQLVNNLIWFGISLVIAFFVWMTAMSQSDPIEQWRLPERIPIRVTPDEGLIITNASTLTSTASVQLRAQRSVRQLLAADDITVYADLSGLGPGTFTVPLSARVARDRRATVAGISPSQITVTLEVQGSRLVPVRLVISAPPPLVVSAGTPQHEVRQVTVSGPSSRVERVVEAVGTLDLSAQRETFVGDVRLVPLDSEGNEIREVTLEPQVILGRVEIEPNSEIREVRVQPNPVGELPEGYVLTSFDYEPRIVYISGSVEALSTLAGTLLTTPIDLSGKTSSFQEQVTVQLPNSELVIVTGGTITVTVGIDTQTVTRQFDRVDIEFINSRSDLEYRLDPTEVSVLVTGPQPLLNDLTEEDVRVLVDVGGLQAGSSYQITPVASIGQDVDTDNIAVLPAQIDVQVINPGLQPTLTPDTER